jgi:hypothetical protein
MMKEMRSATMVKNENMNYMVEMGKMSNSRNGKCKIQN